MIFILNTDFEADMSIMKTVRYKYIYRMLIMVEIFLLLMHMSRKFYIRQIRDSKYLIKKG